MAEIDGMVERVALDGRPLSALPRGDGVWEPADGVAARAVARVFARGVRGITDLSMREIAAMAAALRDRGVIGHAPPLPPAAGFVPAASPTENAIEGGSSDA